MAVRDDGSGADVHRPFERPDLTQDPVTRGDVAKGAGLAGLARAGALIELVAQPVYTWLYGLANYGIYVVLWGVVNLLANVVDLSMTAALQRLVPAEQEEERAHAMVKFALIVSVLPAALIALVVSLNADQVAALFSAAPEDRDQLPVAVALFAWALPLWTFVEVATSAARARRAFGPEIRLRIFWEQIARILFALLFFGLGLHNIGLMVAHLCSLLLTALLCLPLLARYYDLRLLVRSRLPRGQMATLLGSGLALLPSNLSRRLLIDAPPVVLNLMLPGAQGASAAGLFEIARKISTVPYIVRQSFQYVLAPLSAAQASASRAAVAPLYLFATRVSTALALPLGGLLIFAAADILSLYRPEIAAALPLLYILVGARAFEAVAGPAATIVEMTGHRALSVLNSLLGVGVWAGLMMILAPLHGAVGMAIAVAAGSLVGVYAAMIELRISDGISPLSRKLFAGLGISLAGTGAMAVAERLGEGPLRFLIILGLWAATSWLALRFGLTREDRVALGSLSRHLRLVS